EGEDVIAPADTIVSPTYVPHLAHAALDLLIDGEHGIWHLANAGAVSWFGFARRAAALCDRRPDRIQPGATAQVWQPAVRPVHSALGSARGAVMPPLGAALEAWAGAWRAPRVTVGAGSCGSR